MVILILGTAAVCLVAFDFLLEAVRNKKTGPLDEGDEWRWCGTILRSYQCPRCLSRYDNQMNECPNCKKKLKKYSGMKFYKLTDELF